MASQLGPVIPHYDYALDKGALYEWIVGNTDTVDSVTVFGHVGGTVGRWRLVRRPLQGADLTDADVDIEPSGDFIRVVPASTLTVNRVATMETASARDGDIITVVRLDTEAFTYTINNGGPAAGTLVTMPVSVQAFADLYFDGTDWIKLRAAQML